jgi:hypothetical protein
VAGILHGVEALRLVVDQALDVPHHQVGIEIAAVVKLHAFAQLEDPSLVVGGVDGPLGGEARRQRRFPVGTRQVPVDQRVVERPAHEAVALEALVGLSRPVGDVTGSHGNAQDGLGARGRRCKACERERGGEQRRQTSVWACWHH